MPKFTAQQRAELRDAFARSRIEAENESIRLRNATARAARSRLVCREPVEPMKLPEPVKVVPIAPEPPKTPRRERDASRCVYCGSRTSIPYACWIHSELLAIDIPDVELGL